MRLSASTSCLGSPDVPRTAIDLTHVASGKQYNVPYEGHLWLFNDAGMVVKYQHVTDTALHARMAKGE